MLASKAIYFGFNDIFREKKQLLQLTGEMKLIESETLESTIASVFHKDALAFNVVDSPNVAALVHQCIKFHNML